MGGGREDAEAALGAAVEAAEAEAASARGTELPISESRFGGMWCVSTETPEETHYLVISS